VYDRYAASEENTFLGIFKTRGLDGTKTSLVDLAVKANDEKASTESRDQAQKELDTTLEHMRKSEDPNRKAIARWCDGANSHAVSDSKLVDEASLYGGKM